LQRVFLHRSNMGLAAMRDKLRRWSRSPERLV
jgi:hypothetical protein